MDQRRQLRQRFAEVVAGDAPGGSGQPVALDEGAFLVAAHARPDLDVAAQMGRLDAIARGCSSATLEGVRQYLFEELGFRGNGDDYGDPDNSYLDAVLDRRLGIPITLSVVTMEVGRRVGVPFVGIGMPGHFLVRVADEPGLFVDPFHGGRFLGEPECRDLFARVHGSDVAFRSEYLEAVDHRSILWRILNNLRASFVRTGRLSDLRWVLELQLEFPILTGDERRRLAALLGSTGALARAADELEVVAGELPGPDAERVERQARLLRARLN